MTSRYIVIRPGPDLPAGFLPTDWDGRWLDRDLPAPPDLAETRDVVLGRAHATGRYETRGDGERAEVFEVHA
jgi:hypothetical protein